MMDDYPELEKMRAVESESRIIGEFIDRLESEKQIYLAEFTAANNEYLLMTDSKMEGLLAEFFKIDSDKAEEEKKVMISKYLRMDSDE